MSAPSTGLPTERSFASRSSGCENRDQPLGEPVELDQIAVELAREAALHVAARAASRSTSGSPGCRCETAPRSGYDEQPLELHRYEGAVRDALGLDDARARLAG